MRKSRVIKFIIAVTLVLAVFVSLNTAEPKWTNAVRPGDEGWHFAQSIGDSETPLSGGSFVFSGDEEESSDDSSQAGETGETEDGSAEAADDSEETKNTENTGSDEEAPADNADELVSRTIQADIVADSTQTGIISRIRKLLRASGSDDLNKNDDINLSGLVPEDAVAEAKKEDIRIKGENILAAYDIKIFAAEEAKEDGSVWQPEDESITVSIRSDALKEAKIVDVYHMENEDSDAMFVGSARAKDGEVRFEAESFSIYVIAVHEDGNIVTPRVEFHYLAKAEGTVSDDNGTAVYSAEPYSFRNKAGDAQTSIILSDGESLNSIEAPESGRSSDFRGWYQVNIGEEASSGGAVTYSWPEDMTRIEAGSVISIKDNGDGTLTWKLNGAEKAGGKASMDEDGCAHIYVAPIYDKYCFVNFHLGAIGSSTQDSITSRKLVAVGSRGTADVLISDITAPSEDPDRRTFVGWEYKKSGEDGGWEVIRTLDNEGKVIGNKEGSAGTYLTMSDRDIDLYPVFAEIRWVNFNVGESHNGAAYVAPRYVYSSDNIEGEVYPADSLVTAKRLGYVFGGWYTEPDGTGEQITDGDGKIVNSTYSESCDYTDAEGNTKRGKAFEIKDGSLYVYNALERLTLYARWIPEKEAPYKVIIWKQKVSDDKNAADEEKTYDYYIYYDRMTDDTSKTVSPSSADLRLAETDPNGDFIGFHLGRYDRDVMPDPQGTTVLNVYYDRNEMKIIFKGYPDYTRETGSLSSSEQYYALIDGVYVSLSRYTSSGWFSSSTSYYYLTYDGDPYSGTVYSRSRLGSYSATTSYSYNNTYYGAVDGYYRQLSWTNYSGDDYYVQDGTDMTWSGLYQQTFEKNGYSWSDVASYQWKENKTNTIQTLLTGFTQESSPYELTCNGQGGAPAIYHYKQNLDGTYSSDAAFTAYSSQTSGTFNFSNKFEGFTVAAYSTEFNSEGAGKAAGEGSQASVTYPIHVYHTRNSGYSLTFTPNYPKGTDTSDLAEPTVYSGLSYEQPLTDYAGQAAPPAPDNYSFDGWYEDASGTVPFDFSSEKMPAGNKVVYAKWKLVSFLVRIDPAGGIMDHIDYTNADYRSILEPTGLTGNTHNNSCATYFNNTATEYISLDSGITRPFVQISNSEAASMEAGTVYRYVNMQYIEDYGSYDPDARNAVYILDTRESIDAYYKYYAKVIADSGDGSAVPKALWESKYLSSAKYRRLRPGESYRFMGWHETGAEDGSSYDFEKPTLRPTELKASWTLEGSYTLKYTTEYHAPNGDVITADFENLADTDGENTKYTDQAMTVAPKEPLAITVNGRESDDYQLLGWQIVKVYNIAGVPHYTPLEPGVYYTAGSKFAVSGRFADENMVIHMQAVYEKRNEARRRPDTVQLTLDASSDARGAGRGYIAEGESAALMTEGDRPGYICFNTDEYLYEKKPTQILFGDYQADTAIHLYRFASDITENVNGDKLDPAGTNYFAHSEGYSLIGFDRGRADTDFIPDYATDAVVSVSPGEAETLYAVWEPMVYMTFVNDTDAGDVTFSISGSGQSALQINRVDGRFDRTALDPSRPITVKKGETVRLALPRAEGETVTVRGTDELGTGYSLTAESSLNGEARQLTGAISGEDTDYKHVANGEEFAFSENLVADPEGVRIRFTAELAPHTLILKDNYNGDGSGGGSKEIQFSEKTDGTVYFNKESNTSYDLPSTSTRLGYEFAGWDTDPAADKPAFSEDEGWTIGNLAQFFNGKESVTLHAVWKANAEASTVYVWNEVPEPGDQNKEFEFRISFAGTFTYQQNTNGKSSGWSGTKSDTMSDSNCSGSAEMEGVFSLKHGEYLKVTTIKDESQGSTSRPSLKVNVQRYSADGSAVGSPEELVWTWSHINYNNTGSSYRYRNFSFADTNVSVTQEDYTPQYDTAVKVAAETTDYPLAANEKERNVSWNSSFAGGTLIFTNSRRTADVVVRSILLPASAPAEEFSFTAYFADDAEGSDAEESSSEEGSADGKLQYESYKLVSAGKKMISGSSAGESLIGEWKIEGVPTGAVLVITEDADQDRFTVRTGGVTVSGDDEKGMQTAADLDTENDNIFSFTVTGDTEVEFTNTLKSQKVRLAVTDDSEPAKPLDSAEFTFPGIFEGTRYSAADTGIVWEGTAYAGTYRLTETEMPNRMYDKMALPAEITVAGSGVSVSDGAENVSVSGPDDEGVYTITVINPALVKISISNTVVGGDPAWTFGYTANIRKMGKPVVRENVTDSLGSDEEGNLTFTLVHNQSVELYVPKKSVVTIEQTEDPAYYTSYQLDGGDLKAGRTARIRNISSDASVVFTNESNPPAPTGVTTRILPYALLACGAVLILLLGLRRKSGSGHDDGDDPETDRDPEQEQEVEEEEQE